MVGCVLLLLLSWTRLIRRHLMIFSWEWRQFSKGVPPRSLILPELCARRTDSELSHWAIMTRATGRTDSELSHWAIMIRATERTDSEPSHWAIMTRGPRGGQTVSYLTELSWPGPQGGQTVSYPTELSWPAGHEEDRQWAISLSYHDSGNGQDMQAVRYSHSLTELSWPMTLCKWGIPVPILHHNTG